MWLYRSINLRSNWLTLSKVVVNSKENCSNCLFVEAFNYF